MRASMMIQPTVCGGQWAMGRVMTLLCVLLLAAPLAAQVGRDRGNMSIGGEGPAGVQRASCVLQLDFGAARSSRLVETKTLNAMLTSTAVVDPAARDALGLGPDSWPKVAQVELVPAGNYAVRLGVTVTHHPEIKVPENAAHAFLDQLSARARHAVDQVGIRQEQALAERRGELEKELAAARERLTAIQAKMREAQAASRTDTGRSLRVQGGDRQTLEANMVAQKARLRVIEAELEKTETAPATSPWMELIAAREKVVQALRQRAERAPDDELVLLQAEASLAEARALAAADTSSGRRFDPIDRWRTEVINLRAAIAEAEARLELMGASETPADTTQPAVDLNQLRQEEMRANQEVSQITSQLEQLRRESLTNTAPRLLILDGKVEPK